MGSATSSTRGLESAMFAKNPPPTPSLPPPPPQAGPADNLLEARSPSPPVVPGSLGEPPATAGARSSSAPPAADGGEAQLGSQEPPPASAPPPSRRRNRGELAAEWIVEQPEADDTIRGNKRQMVVHCVLPEWSAGFNVQVKLEYAADHVVATAPARLTCPICLNELEEPSVTLWRLTCSICLNELEEPSVTTCGHVFCDRCLKQAVRVYKACPNCRKKLCRSSIRRIYLPTSST